MTIYDANGKSVLDVDVDDTSYRHREVMGDDTLVLKFSLAEHVETPVGATTTFGGETYTLARPEALTMRHSRDFEYTVTMEGPQYRAGMWKFRNTSDGRVKFSLTAKPSEHLQMFVDNMNAREGGWTAGECIDHDEVCVCYDHAYCLDALSQMAEAFGTEWEIDGAGRVVHLRRVEYYRDAPLELSYGRGNGLKPDVGRSNTSDTPPVEVLYAQGGTDNIDAGKYPQDIHGDGGEYGGDGTGTAQNTHSSELLLPPGRKIGYDGETFLYEGDAGWDGEDVRHYVVDDHGYSVRRSDKDLETMAEDSLDCSEIYPKRVGEVTEVREVENTGGDVPFIDFIDATIPEGLDYSECLIEGETMTVVFQSGNLAGREFDVNYIHSERRFEVVPDEIDGITMPQGEGKAFAINAGDRYAVFNCMLPSSYICDDGDHSGAEWDMLRECVRYFYENEEQKFTFTGKMDGIWSKNDWDNIGAKIRPGGHILFSDPRFQPEGELVRIVGVKDYINSPQSPELELSNGTVTPGFASTVKEIESREMLVDESYRSSLQFTKRRFRDAQETLTLLEQSLASLSGEFTEGVSPVSVQTMTMLVGDDALQFRFVTGFGSTTAAAHSVTWDAGRGWLEVEEGWLQHLTLGVTTVTNAEGRTTQEYRTWHIPEAKLTPDDTGARWLYAVVPQSADVEQEGVFRIEKEAVEMSGTDDDGNAAYWLLVGILNSEYGGDRSFAQMYGYTEVSPGRITTGRIVSGDGNTYFDLDLSEIGGTIDFADGLISGVIGIGHTETGDDGTRSAVVKAGLSAEGETDDSVRIWAGSRAQDREGAAFRVTQDGSLYAESGTFAGFLRVAFADITAVCGTDSDGAYILALDHCNLKLPIGTAGYSVLLPYDGDDPSRYSGAVFNLFLYYKLDNDIYSDELVVDANGGIIWYYNPDEQGIAVNLKKITFYGGYVQLICLGDNEWIIAANNARETVMDPNDIERNSTMISVSPTKLTFTADGGSGTVSLTSTDAWTVEEGSWNEWLTVSPASGDKTVSEERGAISTAYSITVTADKRSSDEYTSRYGSVTFRNGQNGTAFLSVEQEGRTRYYKLTITLGFGSSAAAGEERPTPTLAVNGTWVRLTEEGDDLYSWSGEYEEGSSVTYEAAADGYRTVAGSVTMNGDKTVAIRLTTANLL